MKRIAFVIFALILLCFPKPIFAHSQVQIIEMTPNGFEPNEVIVDENATILFVNKDKEYRWPASNVHPTHDLYPAFDPREPIAPNASWPFRPTKTGEWKFHDHIYPHMRGLLTVKLEKNAARKPQTKNNSPSIFDTIAATITKWFGKTSTTISKKLPEKTVSIQAFKKLSAKDQEKYMQSLAENNNAAKAWEYLKTVFKNDPGSSGNIHDLAHLSGILIYGQEGFTGIKTCTSDFAFGCYHGFLDKAFAKSLDSLSDAERACLTLQNQGKQISQSAITGPVASCIHGIGHGVASFHAVTDLNASLRTCRKLDIGQEYCYDGVFMEFVRNASPSFFKKDDPLYPCDMLEKEFGYSYSFACGRNQPSLLMGRFQMGFDEVAILCLSSTSTPFREACIDSLGFSLARLPDTEKIIAACQAIADPVFVIRCLKAAAGEMVFQEIPDWWEKAPLLCDAAGKGKEECIAHIERLMSEYGRKKPIRFDSYKKGTDVNVYIQKQMGICYETGGRDDCYKKAASVLYENLGFSQTMLLLKMNEAYPEVYARCHEVTHYLSRLEYTKQKSIAKTYALCDSTCHGGCYHGTMEAYLKEQESKPGFQLSNNFPKICGKLGDYQKPLEFFECLHGLGHAAMFVTDMELFESLQLCDTIRDQANKERCYTGVFMENSSSSTSFDHKSAYIKDSDPFYPCNSLEEKYQPLCWQYQSSYFAIISKQDWRKVADLCLKIPKQYQDRCIRTIGTNQVGFTVSQEQMKIDCDLMPNPHLQSVCVGGVVSSLSYRFVGDTPRMLSFCEIAEQHTKEACYRQIATSVLDWSPNRDLAKKECKKTTDSQGLSWCMDELERKL